MIKSLIQKIAPSFLLNLYYLSLPFWGAVFYRFPSKEIKVIGVTGTNGKSTVVLMTAKILEEAGFKTASLSSINFKIGDKEWPNTLKMTMPGRFKIQQFLRQAADSGCSYAVLEVTSEGIKQHRHKFIDFDTIVFTNLSPEHIERHGGFEQYKKAKGELFETRRNTHIINFDDKNFEYFWQFPAGKKIKYGVRGERVFIDGQEISLKLKLPEEFNLYNAAAAMAVGLSHGVDAEICKRALEKIERIPGRMEMVIREPFRVIVDYAHTPTALENVYKTISGRKICVLSSAGGGRDKWKRPELGKIASQYCDEIILTNEDPYDENPQDILEQIEGGFSAGRYGRQKILDRREAIKKAMVLARPGDAVIITGKGSEPWMCMAGGKKIPWDEKKIVLDIFAAGRNLF